MKHSRKTLLLAVTLVGLLAIVFFLVKPILQENRHSDVLEESTGNMAVNSTAPSQVLSSPGQTVTPLSKQQRFEEAKKRLPTMSEAALRKLIEKGLNVENIESGRTKVDTDITHLLVALIQYKEALGAFPSGTSTDIAKALIGENPKKTVFIDWTNNKMSTQGEFMDQWGTAYQITVKNESIAIMSSGPDKKMNTKDDVVVIR